MHTWRNFEKLLEVLSWRVGDDGECWDQMKKEHNLDDNPDQTDMIIKPPLLKHMTDPLMKNSCGQRSSIYEPYVAFYT